MQAALLTAVSAGLLVLLAADGRVLAGDTIAVLTGHTVKVGGVSHRLYGIVAPAPGDQCTHRGADRDCGRLSRAALMDLTAGAEVTCGQAPAGQHGSKCLSNGYDVSEGMVHTGWAEAEKKAPPRLLAIMNEAKAHRRGMWRDR